mgnify:CR=1 FL=1
MNKIVVILGPTASGKSALAVKLAHKINGEIISADSRQVYKGLNIGTGKITQKEKRGIKHFCFDVASPKKIYSAFDFKKCAKKAIENIFSRKKTPIICGGTGFYIDVALRKMQLTEMPPNWKLRKKLEKKSSGELFKMLRKLNPERAKNIDRHNPRRLIRAIEITKKLGSPSTTTVVVVDNGCRFLQIGIKLPEKELKKRIEKRVRKMIKNELINEVKKLRKQGLSWKRLYELGFEYKYPALFLQGKISKSEMLKRMILENWHYAKRQMTWFKRDKKIIWSNSSNLDKVNLLVKKFLK